MTTQAHGMTAGLPRSVRSIHWIGLTLLLLALVAAAPLWTGPGLVNTRGGGDSPFLFFRLQQLVTNLRDGVFPARWMPDAAYGLGYPFFNYYAALPYYFAAIFNLIGFDLLVSIKIVQTLGFIFAGLAMYRWANRHFPARWAAWLAAIAYVYAPFHFVNVYVRGDSLSEFYAFIFYPLILLALDRVIESPRSFGSLALAYGGLILTHNVSALIFSPFVLLYAFIRLPKSETLAPRCGCSAGVRSQKSKIAALAFGLLLALALSAWFWLPALGEANLVQLDNQTTGYFNYAEHFRSTDLVQPSIGFDYSINAAPGSVTPFAMGLLQALGTIGGLAAIVVTWKRDSHKSMRVFALIGLALSTLMITPLSRLLWDTLPLLSLTQFPWRFLSIQAFFTSCVIGYVVSLRASRSAFLAACLGLTLVATMLLPLHPEYLPIRADEITPDNLESYEAFTGNIGTTIRAEYLPRTTIPRPYTGWGAFNPFILPPPPIVSEGDATTNNTALVKTSSTRQTWQVVVASDMATIDFPLLYWPGWTAAIDSQAVEARPAPDLGYIQIDVPRGEHRIEFSLGRTPIRVAGETISIIAVLILIILWGTRMVTGYTAIKNGVAIIHISPNILLGSVIVIATVGLAIVTQSIYAVPEGVDDLTMDFADMPWLHHNPGGIDFGSARLLWSSWLSETPDQISIGLNWEVTTTPEVTATLALVAPSSHLFGGPGPITQLEIPVRSGYAQYILHAPYQLPFGTYYVRVQVGERVEYLRPVWVSEHDHMVALSSFGKLTSVIGLASTQVQHLALDRLDVLLKWSVSGAIDANYGISLRLRR